MEKKTAQFDLTEIRLPVLDEDNPFDTPMETRSAAASGRMSVHSVATSYALSQMSRPMKRRKFKSARLVGEYEKPWVNRRDHRMLWDTLIFIGIGLLGMGIGGYRIWTGWASVDHPSYCLVFEDDFSNGIDPNNWSYEIGLNGFGANSFEWTTDDKTNCYTDAEGLHIVPTLTTETTSITPAQLQNGYTLNLTASGQCSSANTADCVAVSNSTFAGNATIINPVRSARILTQGKHSIRYGKVEVVAKLPKGDWLWPAIWMMPETSAYGAWPASGEIDIMEARGNAPPYNDGLDRIGSTLHWGPDTILDMYTQTTGGEQIRRTDYSQDFHTYGLAWSDSYIFMYVDSQLAQSLYIPFGSSWGTMYDRGKFGNMIVNGSVPQNPWAGSGNPNAPFDQSFYLILNVAVGATSGYFPDGYGNKPWVDKSAAAMSQFWNASSNWLPTWGAGDTRGMTVKSVKMWSLGDCPVKP